ncbi:MAG: hypothetical protein LH645_04660 [Actinomycetia bacterium]|nr:hypothetical protein [Actinomycetes bacterium]
MVLPAWRGSSFRRLSWAALVLAGLGGAASAGEFDEASLDIGELVAEIEQVGGFDRALQSSLVVGVDEVSVVVQEAA